MVMLGPPNQGSELTKLICAFDPFGFFITAKEIHRWHEFVPRLATPEFEFGIVAGGRGAAGRGYNPWLRDDNDFIVTVDSTRLAGAADFVLLPVLHAFMGQDSRVREYTLNFLRKGYFIAPDRRQPIVDDADLANKEPRMAG